MDIHDECKLSFYKKLTTICEHKKVYLVQHIESRHIYVQKELLTYDKSVYEYLKNHEFMNIPRVYECVKDDGRLILIEEYINGENLEEIIQRRGNLEEHEVLEIVMMLCDILGQLHKTNPPIVHRDIKPSNIILTNDRCLKLVDFNTAKFYKEKQSKDTVLMGTRDFAAPEQYGFGQSDARTDIYGIGVLMNYLLCGKLPDEQKVEGKISAIIEKCIVLAPERRYQSVRELKDDIRYLMESKCAKQKHPTYDLDEPEQMNQKQSYLPPGFRSKKPSKMILASIGYLFLTYICLSLEVTTKGVPATGIILYANRVLSLILFLSYIAFYANYRGIQRYFPLMNEKYRKWGYVVNFFVIGMLVVLPLVILENALK